MAVPDRYRSDSMALRCHVSATHVADVRAILAKRRHNGGDLWATPDGRLGVGSPFSTLDCAFMLSELGVDNADPVMEKTAALILSSLRDDGRFRLAPGGAIYPCHTTGAARVLCHMGRAADRRLGRTFEHLMEIQHGDGGWRCNKYSFGRGPETASSNPGPTLAALDAFRFTPFLNREAGLDRAVEFLLGHWETREPLGPCHYGIGSIFMKVEFPFLRYNLFHYVHTLSFYNRAKRDRRFLDALKLLESKLVNGKVVVENPNRKLSGFAFCRKGEPSDLATDRYREILKNSRIR